MNKFHQIIRLIFNISLNRQSFFNSHREKYRNDRRKSLRFCFFFSIVIIFNRLLNHANKIRLNIKRLAFFIMCDEIQWFHWNKNVVSIEEKMRWQIETENTQNFVRKFRRIRFVWVVPRESFSLAKRYRLFCWIHVFHSTVAHRIAASGGINEHENFGKIHRFAFTNTRFTNTHKTSKTPSHRTIQPKCTNRLVQACRCAWIPCTVLRVYYMVCCWYLRTCARAVSYHVHLRKRCKCSLYTCARDSTHTGDRCSFEPIII